MNVLQIDDLHVRLRTHHGVVEPVRGVSLTVGAGECVALVVESGSGKTMTALSVMRLLPKRNTQVHARSMTVAGRDTTRMTDEEVRDLRGLEMAMVFQEPMTSFNPVMRIGPQVGEAVRRPARLNRAETFEAVVSLLTAVEIPDARRVARLYPHQLSGGMRQRAMIAMALAARPSLLIADEPTTALDVSTQAAVLDVLSSAARERDTAILLVTHDVGVVAQMAQRVVVMYAGQVVESASTDELFTNPQHPYTRGLLASVPRLTNQRRAIYPTIQGAQPTTP